MKIAIGADAAGYSLKEKIKEHLISRGDEVVDFGTYSDASVHYPIYGYKVAKCISDKDADFGILVCGTGIGMSMVANKLKGVRAACVSEHFSAKATRLHNNANVICLGERVIGAGLAIELVDIFLDTPAEGGRHADRVGMISEIENGTFTAE